MVQVAGAYCIDRFEVSLVDAKTAQALSPHYPPEHDLTKLLYEGWLKKAPSSRMSLGRNSPLPTPPPFQLSEAFSPRAQSLRGQIPAGYLSRTTAERACQNAGKRLCSRGEWVRACRGERGVRFPYGDAYQDGVCNVHRKSHPASLLHGNASKNHLDPRLGLTQDEDGPLLRSTGELSACVSRWGNDGIYDMVGNLDEWIEEPTGSFVGGFFSRATREGCDASIDSHAPGYLDYSLGTRCCVDPP
jgi:formylglycine-generating enzyme required for sulfatase activity